MHPSLWNCAIDWRTSLLLQPRLPANQLISFWPSCMALAMLALDLPRSGLVQQGARLHPAFLNKHRRSGAGRTCDKTAKSVHDQNSVLFRATCKCPLYRDVRKGVIKGSHANVRYHCTNASLPNLFVEPLGGHIHAEEHRQIGNPHIGQIQLGVVNHNQPCIADEAIDQCSS